MKLIFIVFIRISTFVSCSDDVRKYLTVTISVVIVYDSSKLWKVADIAIKLMFFILCMETTLNFISTW